jgi:hypothetical protein
MFKKTILFALMVLGTLAGATAQNITTPKDHFGFAIGTDYHLATFDQTEEYFKKIASESDRIKLLSIGKTAEGNDQHMLIVTSPENHKNLDQYRETSVKLARAEGVTEQEARALSKSGKAVVWIDGGLHATETVGIHQLIETIYQFTSRSDEETMNILDNVIILFVHANPDGQNIVSNWYMRNPEPEKRKLDNLPVLYQKYIGHDNNRDFYIQNMPESRNMGYQLFVEWIPQIMYNHHQRGPAGSVLAGPPYRDPFNYLFEPLMVTGIDAVGAAMYNRLITEDKPGFTRMTGSTFSTWYNGGLRTTTHYHNMIGILTEIIGGPNPEDLPLVPDRLLPTGATPFPATPQKDWRFRRSIDYSVSLNYALLDYAARNKDHLLYNIYSMGVSAINKGTKDYWSPFPKKIEEIKTAYETSRAQSKNAQPQSSNPFSRGTIPEKFYDSVYRAPAKRDPKGFIIPANQADFNTAVKYVNALIRTGIRIEKATGDFTVAGKSYPKGSYIVKSDQAFRAHVLDMFEPQDYPNDFQYPGGPPIRPYDAAGWTLAYQMNVDFDRILDSFEGPFETLVYGQLEPMPTVSLPSGGSGFLISALENDAFPVVNQLLKAGVSVSRTSTESAGSPAGSFYIASSAKSKLQEILKTTPVPVTSASGKPSGLTPIKKQRIALFDSYGGSMPSGWVRWILEQNSYDFDVVFAKEIDGGNLNDKYDIILFISGGIPAYGPETGGYGYGRAAPKEADTPAEYHAMLGSITVDKSIPQLKSFVEKGGKILTVGNSASLAYHLGLPVKDALTEMTREGKEVRLSGEKYYIPGSVLQVKVDTKNSSSWGMDENTDVLFNNSMVFKFRPEAALQGVEALAWFDKSAPLRSGWAWGESYLKDGIVAFKAPLGKGKVFVFSPEITYRAQSHGTYKWLFNALYQ